MMFKMRIELETDTFATAIEQCVPDSQPGDYEELTFEVLNEIRSMFAAMMPAGAAAQSEGGS